MNKAQSYLRALLIETMQEIAMKLNAPIKSKREIIKVVNQMSDYEVDQIWAEAYHYAKIQYPDLPWLRLPMKKKKKTA